MSRPAVAAAHESPSGLFTPRSVLVKGAAGFIGSHDVRALSSRYRHYHPALLDKMDYRASTDNLRRGAGSSAASSRTRRWCRGC
jgi:nucleoside-diphosphate-sugar epimerase